jgi:hypothetical protein
MLNSPRLKLTTPGRAFAKMPHFSKPLADFQTPTTSVTVPLGSHEKHVLGKVVGRSLETKSLVEVESKPGADSYFSSPAKLFRSMAVNSPAISYLGKSEVCASTSDWPSNTHVNAIKNWVSDHFDLLWFDSAHTYPHASGYCSLGFFQSALIGKLNFGELGR